VNRFGICSECRIMTAMQVTLIGHMRDAEKTANVGGWAALCQDCAGLVKYSPPEAARADWFSKYAIGAVL